MLQFSENSPQLYASIALRYRRANWDGVDRRGLVGLQGSGRRLGGCIERAALLEMAAFGANTSRSTPVGL